MIGTTVGIVGIMISTTVSVASLLTAMMPVMAVRTAGGRGAIGTVVLLAVIAPMIDGIVHGFGMETTEGLIAVKCTAQTPRGSAGPEVKPTDSEYTKTDNLMRVSREQLLLS